MAQPDYILDIASLRATENTQAAEASAQTASGNSPAQGRPWLAILWRCCSVYSRVYRKRDAAAYEARCPRCSRHLKIAVGEGGTDSRFFEAR